MQNINDAADTNTDCAATGDAYGTNDTINLPTGTVMLTANLPGITKAIAIHGQGMTQSIVNGAGTWSAFLGNPSSALMSFRDMKIIGFSGGSALRFSDVNLDVRRVDIDGSETTGNSITAIVNVNNSADSTTANYSDVYVHNITTTNAGNGSEGSIGILNGALGDGNNVAILERVTIGSLTSNKLAIGYESFSGFNALSGKASFIMKNSTISNIVSSGDSAAGIVGVFVSISDDVNNYSIENSTITGIESQNGQVGDGAGILIVAGAYNQGAVVQINLSASNVLVANNKSSFNSSNCRVLDATVSLVNGSGSANFNWQSQGGNLTDDTSCSPYFNQPTDQNNLTTLSTTLGSLSNNGGYVPTIPLLKGSPAVDSGITVAGLTTDARLAARPQGSAYDSGAYESPYTKPVATLASTGNNSSLLAAIAAILVTCSFLAVSLLRKFSTQLT